MADRLYRSRDERMIGGVAAGMADTLNLDPTLVRIAWVILALVTGGVAVLLYFALLFVIPEEPYPHGFAPGGGITGTTAVPPDPSAAAGSSSAGRRYASAENAPPASRDARQEARRSDRAPRGDSGRSGGLILGLILIVIGVWFLVRRYLPQFDTAVVWPFILVGLGVLLIVIALGRGGRSAD